MLFKVYHRNGDVMGYIDRYLDCKFVDNFPNDTDTLEITFYENDIKTIVAGRIGCECVLEVKDKTTAKNIFPAPDSVGLRYVVKEPTYHDNKTFSAFCKLDLGTLEDEKFVVFNPDAEALTVNQLASYVLGQHAAGWSVEFSTDSPPDTTISAVLQMELCSPLDVIKAGAGVYGYEYYIDQINRKVVFGTDLSSNTVVMSTRDLNISQLEATEDSIELYNEVEAYGKDGMPIVGAGSVDSDGRRYFSNYGYLAKPKRLVIRDDKYTTQASLQQFATNKLQEVSTPKTSYKVNMIDLGRIIEGTDIQQLNVGDIVRVEKPEEDLFFPFVNLRITQMTRYPDNPDQNTCVLSTVIKKTEDYLKQSADTASTVTRLSNIVQKINDDKLDFVAKNISVTMSASTVVAGGDGIFIRKWGKVVTITGSVVMAATGNNQVIASFGTDAAPTRATFVSCNAGGASTQSTCLVTTSGTVCVNAFSTDTLRIHGVWITS